ncbi:MAG: hypothetical protein JEZ12_23265 [Desulfobacterium sp.]|nr:hypothetical protein [Desulfobacterium sp.]
MSMTPTPLTQERKKFTMALCAEHLDEAAFLYALSQNILTKPSVPWSNAQQFEDRLGAHLNALSMEGELAIDACQPRTDSSDPGDFYVLARIACRKNQPGLIGKMLDNLALDNEKKIMALGNALIDEAPCHPERVLDILATHAAPPRLVARVAGDARLKHAWPLIALQNNSPDTLAPVLRWAGRIYNTDTVPLLLQSLDHDDGDVQAEAALGLLRLGNNQDVINHCRSQNKPMLALGLGGGKSAVSFLMGLAESGPITRDMLIALGLLGDVSAIPILIDGLGPEDLSESAAQVLELITGAGIKETIFIPEEIDKKELFRDELEKLEREGRLFPPGEEPGVIVTRISKNPESWRGWMDDNSRRFVAGIRYRNGRPCSPECLIKNMQSETLPGLLRQFAHEEMVIRYKKDFPFGTDRPASFQKQAIQKYEAWAKTADKSYQPGQWYFSGLLMA